MMNPPAPRSVTRLRRVVRREPPPRARRPALSNSVRDSAHWVTHGELRGSRFENPRVRRARGVVSLHHFHPPVPGGCRHFVLFFPALRSSISFPPSRGLAGGSRLRTRRDVLRVPIEVSVEPVHLDSVVTPQQVDEKQAAYDAAVANLASGEANYQRLVELRFERVTAPFSGVVTSRSRRRKSLDGGRHARRRSVRATVAFQFRRCGIRIAFFAVTSLALRWGACVRFSSRPARNVRIV